MHIVERNVVLRKLARERKVVGWYIHEVHFGDSDRMHYLHLRRWLLGNPSIDELTTPHAYSFVPLLTHKTRGTIITSRLVMLTMKFKREATKFNNNISRHRYHHLLHSSNMFSQDPPLAWTLPASCSHTKASSTNVTLPNNPQHHTQQILDERPCHIRRKCKAQPLVKYFINLGSEESLRVSDDSASNNQTAANSADGT